MRSFLLASIMLLAAGGQSWGGILLTASAPYTQNFDGLASTGNLNTTLPTGWVFNETGGSANGSYKAGNGSVASSDTYSFGTNSSSERALGMIGPGSTIGASFKNDDASRKILALEIAFTGEQWRLGNSSNAGRVDRLDFQYSLDASSLQTGTWTDFDALDFTGPAKSWSVGASVGAKNGNLAAYRSDISSTISSLSLDPGSTFWIRWNDFDAFASDDGLAIDDFKVSAAFGSAISINAVPEPTSIALYSLLGLVGLVVRRRKKN